MNHTAIRCINYYVPERKLPVAELLEQVPDAKVPAAFPRKEEYEFFIRNELKVKEVRVEDTLEDFEMLTGTVEKIFMDETIEPEEIDLILLAQESEQRQKDNLGQFIQYEFDLNNAYV